MVQDETEAARRAPSRRFLTIKECAAEARTSEASIRKWLRRGLKSIRPGKLRLIPRDAFERFLHAESTTEGPRRRGASVS